ncbi:hypothetical protein Rhopal_000663-T1 [Rhodotorula paludigena]|uniref:Dilute domain-containing protein n=1 Tax=Rhodotorula paludigena TaxID=86838 RepID=A0AAV5GBN7_9BASI|nr:hypothetical protein Rhopal_000663-T1 [Rhodotorula paludigena]
MPLDLPSPPLPPLPATPLERSPTLPSLAQRTQGPPRSSTSPSLASLAEPGPAVPPKPAAVPFVSSSNDLRIVLSLLPSPPLPSHLQPYLAAESPLSPEDKRRFFTSVYLRAASAGNADTLEYLLSLPPDPALSHLENAAAARRFSLNAATLNNSNGSIDSIGLGLGGAAKRNGGLSARQAGKAREHDDDASADGYDAIALALPDSAPRKWIDLEATDDDGNTALGTCVALGHAEAVRVLVESGVKVNQGDRAGWTPLHWAVQNNDIPIASYLLNHRASPLLASHKGLTPRDLVKPGRESAAMREVLKSAWEAALERERALRRAEEEEVEEGAENAAAEGGAANGAGKDDALFGPNGRPASRLSMTSEAAASWAEQREREDDAERDKEAMQRVQLGMDSARNLEVDFGMLGLEEDARKPDDDVLDSDEGIPNPFVWDRCLPDQMLVFSLPEIPALLDVIISTIKPVRTRKYRVIPANVLFLCARYAHYFGGQELFEELVFGALERTEAAVHNRPDDMSVCAFWLSNCLLFLYYLRKEPNLAPATIDYQTHFEDLVNEIFVFVIRDAERRIDRVLEAALLEHEALPGFEDVAFEDEWASTRFVKKLTGRAKKGSIRSSTSAMSLFSDAGGSSGASVVVAGDTASPPRAGPTSAAAASAARIVSASTIPVHEATPRSITALLSSTLFVLQIYEIPPAIIVQAFSQLFYWIACEVFNRLLNQRKYLCRSRAMQIRLNASNLEDWARANRLPTKMVSVHFTPLNQLLQWLQCLSSESSIDGLIGTVQSLRALNPLQLRRAVRDYRYEVDENRMDEDCVQYLVQIQKQWERNRSARQHASAGSSRAATPVAGESAPNGAGRAGAAEAQDAAASARSEVARAIDEVFREPGNYAAYAPPAAPEPVTELLNSRFMLPFAVPSSSDMLIHFDQPDAFGPFTHSPHPSRHVSSDADTMPRSSSRLSLSSLAPSTGASPSPSPSPASAPSPPAFAPVLPDDFFAVWDAAKAQSGHAPLPAATAALLAAQAPNGFASPELGREGAVGEGWWGGVGGGAVPDEEEEEAREVGDESFEAEGSVIDRGEGESHGDSSFDSALSVEVEPEATPRPPSGFHF